MTASLMKTSLILAAIFGLSFEASAKGGVKADRVRAAAELLIDGTEEGRVLQSKFESRGETRRRFKVEAAGFDVGTMFTASVKIGNNNYLLGDMTAELNEEGIVEAELDFRQDSWLVGLPTSIPAGSVVTVKQGNNTYLLTLEAK